MIKRTKERNEEIARLNAKGFDPTELCCVTIFEIMRDAILKTIDEITDFDIVYKNQIALYEFKYGVEKEDDEKIYPTIELMINFQDEESKDNYLYKLSCTPFTCKFNKWNNPSVTYSKCNSNLTRCWNIMMKGVFGEKWVEAYKNYCLDVKCLKESEIARKAEMKYLKLEQEYENQIELI